MRPWSRLRENAEGELSVVSPKWIGSLDLGDAVAAFAAEHPKIHVRLELGGLSERTYNFIEDGYDIAFHTKHLRDSSIMIKKIAPLQFVLCAAPAYLDARRCTVVAAGPAKHDTLIHVNDPVWHFTRAGKKVIFKSHRVVFSSDTYLVLQKAAIRGMGIALLPVRSVYQDIHAGTLRRSSRLRGAGAAAYTRLMRPAGNGAQSPRIRGFHCRLVRAASYAGGIAGLALQQQRRCPRHRPAHQRLHRNQAAGTVTACKPTHCANHRSVRFLSRPRHVHRNPQAEHAPSKPIADRMLQ